MTKMTYREQLLHPNWQRKRLAMLEASEWACSCCGGEETTLHVHHKRYIKGRMAWEYEDSQLAVLCANCHGEEHAQREILERLLSESGYGGSALIVCIGLLAGFLDASHDLDDALSDSAKQIDGHTYDLGVLASLASGCGWKKMAAAAAAVRTEIISPKQEAAVRRWEGA